MEPGTFALLALVSFVTGALDASVGSGGLLLLPFLTLLGLPIKTAIGTTRLTFIMDSAAAFLGHLRAGNVDLVRARGLFATLGAGAIIGVFITQASPAELIKHVFALFILLMAGSLFIKVPQGRGVLGRMGLFGGSLMIGIMIGMFGAGLGTVTILFLSLAGFGVLKAAGTSQAMVFFANIFAFSGYYMGGQVDLGLGLFSGCFAALGAVSGVRFATSIGEQRLKRLLFVMVIVMAGALLIS